jgi:hypothetical protein
MKLSKKIILQIQKFSIVFFFGMVFYIFLEVFWGCILNPDGYKTYKNLIAVGILGGSLCINLGILNNYNWFKNKPYKIKCLIGCLVITAAEFVSGLIINKALGWGNWDYSHLPLGKLFLGQITPVYSFIWFLVSPTVFHVSNAFEAIYNFYIGKKTKIVTIEHLIKDYRKLLFTWGKETWIK